MNGSGSSAVASSSGTLQSHGNNMNNSETIITNHDELYSTFCCDFYDFTDDQLNNNRSDEGTLKNPSNNHRLIITTPFTLRRIPLEIISLGDIVEFPSDWNSSDSAAKKTSFDIVESYWRKFKGEYQHPYPSGYTSILRLRRRRRTKKPNEKEWITDNATELIQFQMEVIKGLAGPQFVVTDVSSSRGVGERFTGSNCSQPFKQAFQMYQPEMDVHGNAINSSGKTITDYVYIGLNIDDLTGEKAFGFCEDFLKNLLNCITKQKNLHLPTRMSYFVGRDREYWKAILEKEKAKLLEEIEKLEQDRKRLLETSNTMTDDTVSEESSKVISTAVKRRKKRNKRVIKDVEEDSMQENGADSESSQISPKPSSILSEEVTPLKKLKMDMVADTTPVSNCSPSYSNSDFEQMFFSNKKGTPPTTTEPVISTTTEASPPKKPTQENNETPNLISQDSIAEESENEDNTTTNTRLSLVNMPNSPKIDKLKVISPLQNKRLPPERRNEEFAIPSLPSQTKRSTQESSTQKSNSSLSTAASIPSQTSFIHSISALSTVENEKKDTKLEIMDTSPEIQLETSTETVKKTTSKDIMLDEGEEEIQHSTDQKKIEQDKIETSFNSPPKDTSFTEPVPIIISTESKTSPEPSTTTEVPSTKVIQAEPITEKPKSPLKINTNIPKPTELDSPTSTPDSLPPGDDLLFMEDLEPPQQPTTTNHTAIKQASPAKILESPPKNIWIMPTVDINFNTNDSADLNSPLPTPTTTELPAIPDKPETDTKETDPSPPKMEKPTNISLEKITNDKLDEDDETPQTLPSLNFDITPSGKEKPKDVKESDAMNMTDDDEEVPPTPTPMKPFESKTPQHVIIPPTICFDPSDTQGAVSDEEMEESDNAPPPLSTPPHNTSKILSYTTPKSDIRLEEVEETQYSASKIVLDPGDISPTKKKNPFMQVQDNDSESDEEESPKTPSHHFEIKDFNSPPINFSPILTKPNLGSPPIVNKDSALSRSNYGLEPTIAVNFSLILEDSSDEEEEEAPPSPILASSNVEKSVSDTDPEKNLSTPPLSTPPYSSIASPMRSQPVLSQNSLPRHPIEKIDRNHPLKSYSRIKVKGPVLNMLFSPVGDPRLTICTKTQVSLIELTGSEWVQTELFGLENEENEEFYCARFTPDGEMLIIASSIFEPAITMTMSMLDDENLDNPAQPEGTLTYHIRFFDIDGSSIRSQLGQEKKPLLSLDDIRSPISCMEVYDASMMVATKTGELFKYILTSDYKSRVKVVTFQNINGKEPIHTLQFVPELKEIVIGSTNSFIGIWRMSSGKLLQKISLSPYSVVYSSVIKALTTGSNQGIFLVAIHKEHITDINQSCGLFFLNETTSRVHTYTRKDVLKISESNDSVTAIGVSGNAELSPYLVTGTSKGLIVIFNCRTAQCVGILQDIEGENVGSCCFHDTFPLFAAGGTKNVVIYYQTE